MSGRRSELLLSSRESPWRLRKLRTQLCVKAGGASPGLVVLSTSSAMITRVCRSTTTPWARRRPTTWTTFSSSGTDSRAGRPASSTSSFWASLAIQPFRVLRGGCLTHGSAWPGRSHGSSLQQPAGPSLQVSTCTKRQPCPCEVGWEKQNSSGARTAFFWARVIERILAANAAPPRGCRNLSMA